MLKLLGACHLGAPFQPRALCTYVLCLLIDLALPILLNIGADDLGPRNID